MKHTMHLMRFSYDKIVNGTKRIDLRLFDDEYKKIKLNDIIEYVREDSNKKLICLVRGVVVCERFDDIIELLPVQIFGYDSKEEIKIRVRRIYSFEDQMTHHAIGTIIMPLQEESVENENEDEYLSYHRDEALDLKNSQVKNFTKVNQMVDEEASWKPISQQIEHSEEEGMSGEEKAEKVMRMKMKERFDYDR